MDPKTPFLILHCFGFALGLGGVTILDVMVLHSLRHPLDVAVVRMFETISKLVTFGLASLWLSGLGFLVVYKSVSPDLLLNPKLWAKIVIVGVMTFNGVYLHSRILPILRAQAGRTVLDGVPPRVRIRMLTAAAISVVSWYTPFLLGIVRELNFAASATTFLMAYVVLLGLAWAAIQLAGVTLRGPAPDNSALN
jgi:hypothetical protein